MQRKLLSLVSLAAASLTTAVIVAAPAGAQSPTGVHVGAPTSRGIQPDAKPCYSNLTGDSGNGFYSTKTKNPATYTSAGAADIVLASKCKVKTVQVDGVLIPGNAVTGVTVYLYKDNGGLPSAVALHKSKTTGNFATANFNLTLKHPFTIPAGATYWFSVQATGEYSTNGWYWESSTVVQNTDDVWENPGGAFGHCATWATLQTCFGDDYDYLLQIN
jgi:hypothetical protein